MKKISFLVVGMLLLSGCSLIQVVTYQDSNVTKTVTKNTNGIEALNIGD